MKSRTVGLAVLGLALIPLIASPALARGQGGGKGGGEAWFEAVDADGDGKVTAQEMETYRTERFNAADTNGDGKLSPEEMAAAHEAREEDRRSRGLARMIERLDTDKDGSISAEELASTDRMARAMEHLDADGDGAIALDEMSERSKGHGGKKGKHGSGGERH